jgi:hypothetical protein
MISSVYVWELSHYAFSSLYRVRFPDAPTLPLLLISYCLNALYRYLLCQQIFHAFLTARLTDRQVRATVIATFSKKVACPRFSSKSTNHLPKTAFHEGMCHPSQRPV